MPPRGVKSPKRQRQYAKIKQSAREHGASEERAEELAARVVNKQRRLAGETQGSSKSSAKSPSRRAKPARGTRGTGAKSRGRTSASGKTGRKSSGSSGSRGRSSSSRSRGRSSSSRSKK